MSIEREPVAEVDVPPSSEQSSTGDESHSHLCIGTGCLVDGLRPVQTTASNAAGACRAATGYDAPGGAEGHGVKVANHKTGGAR